MKLLYFTASWCQVCKRIYPIIETLQSEGANIELVDCDIQPDISNKYKIYSVPTFIFVEDESENEVLRLTGAQSESTLRKYLY